MKDFIKARAKVWCVVKACEDIPVLDGIIQTGIPDSGYYCIMNRHLGEIDVLEKHIFETEAEAKAFAEQLD